MSAPAPLRPSLRDAVLLLQGAAIGALLLLVLQAVVSSSSSFSLSDPLSLKLGFTAASGSDLQVVPAWLAAPLLSPARSSPSPSPPTVSLSLPPSDSPRSELAGQLEREQRRVRAVQACDDDAQVRGGRGVCEGRQCDVG